MAEEIKITIQQAQQDFAKSIFNGIWELLNKSDRSPQEDEEMLLRAYASLYHWKQVGGPVNFQRGYWMISRVYQALGDADGALTWAIKCQQETEDHSADLEDFDLAYAQEGLARTYAMRGEQEKARIHYQKALDLGDGIQDPEDKKIFCDDFQGGDWYQLR